MISFDKIKLVIWDLDETLWEGTLSEGTIRLPEKHIELINRLTDAGIVNSICSKNDFNPVKEKLIEYGIWDQFVFPSINWDPKGARIKQLIEDMQLRPVNVLFIDDNPSNLNEAKYFCKDIMTADPSEISDLLKNVLATSKRDLEHKRLKQYRVLEEKREEKKTFTSNEEFLFSSNIRVEWGTDCDKNIDRIHDLVWRSNQLNFTKVRSSLEELKELFNNKDVKCGYVSVTDRFGDYGIVGFFALNRNNELLHFCFSCRTLGMGIEQYVYAKLKCPKLTIVGEVISNLDCMEPPKWINQKDTSEKSAGIKVKNAEAHSVLIKGPCDLFQVLPYIADKSLIDTEFTYIAPNGIAIESTGHTTHLVEAIRLTKQQKKRVVSEVPFLDKGIYNDQFIKRGYKLLVISVLQDANLGVYKRKETGERFAFVEGYHPLTDKKNWKSYVDGEFVTSNAKFTMQSLKQFSEQYEFVGINTPEQVVENLRYIRAHLPKECMLAVMLGGELYYEKNTIPAYKNRHIVHKQINDAVRAVANELDIEIIDVNKYLIDQSSFYDHFNHYIKPVYYQLAGDIVTLINSQTGSNLKKTSKVKMLHIKIKEALAPWYYKVKNLVRK